MPSLRELQQWSYRAIVLDEEFGPRTHARDERRRAARLNVYRNNARATFHKTLAATYPVVERLVGDLCFRSLARSYMRDVPSLSGDLGHYGAEFATLLEVHYRDTGFAYLADVARLEWVCAEAETAADSRTLDWLALAEVAAEDQGRLRFSLRGPVRLVSSRYPVFSIWEAHQSDDVRPVALSAGAEHVLVTRRQGGVEAHRLDAGAFAFARSLADGEPLADACEAGAAAAPDFSPEGALTTLARLDVLAAARVAADELD